MPLATGPVGSAAFRQNIRTEIEHGKAQKQAVAIAYRVARGDVLAECGKRIDNLSGRLDALLKGRSRNVRP